MRVDHVIYGVVDLEAAMRRFHDDYGLEAFAGGEHPQFGTRNALVPVGDGQYVELMAVADPASEHPLSRVLSALLAEGDRMVGVCLAPDDFDAVVRRLSLRAVDAERRTPVGDVLRWRMAGLEAALGPDRMPYFIDWGDSGPGLPAANEGCGGIAWVELGGDRERVGEWVGAADLPFRFQPGPPGPVAFAVRRPDGSETVIR